MKRECPMFVILLLEQS